jgi:hypothetical protein
MLFLSGMSMKNSIFLTGFSYDSLIPVETPAIPILLKVLENVQSIYGKQLDLKYPGSNLYPHDITIEEFNDAIKYDTKIKDPTTVVIRDGSRLKSLPYNEVYWSEINDIVALLKNASEIIPQGRFRDYLLIRASDLQKNSYKQGDGLWLDLNKNDTRLDLILGPFEVYIDRFMGLKTAFEGTLSIRDTEMQDQLKFLLSYTEVFLNHIPKVATYQDNGITLTRLEVMNVIAFSGHSALHKMNAKVLPNDPEVIQSKGTKKILFKNIMEMRLNQIIIPIVKKLFKDHSSDELLKDGYFNFILLHEIAHPMGIAENPSDLGEITTGIEEAKAHMLGLYFARLLLEYKVLTIDRYNALLTALVAYLVADVRLGLHLPTKRPYKDASSIILNELMRTDQIKSDNNGFYIGVNDIRLLKEGVQNILHLRNCSDMITCKNKIEEYEITCLPYFSAPMDEIPYNIE